VDVMAYRASSVLVRWIVVQRLVAEEMVINVANERGERRRCGGDDGIVSWILYLYRRWSLPRRARFVAIEADRGGEGTACVRKIMGRCRRRRSDVTLSLQCICSPSSSSCLSFRVFLICAFGPRTVRSCRRW